MKKGVKKKTQQDIIINVILILIAIAAVVLVATFFSGIVKNKIEEASIASASSSEDLQVKKAWINDSLAETLVVSVYRAHDSSNPAPSLASIKFIFKDSTGRSYSYVDTTTASLLGLFEIRDFIINSSNVSGLVNFSDITYIEIFKGIKTSSGAVAYASVSSSYGYDVMTKTGDISEQIGGGNIIVDPNCNVNLVNSTSNWTNVSCLFNGLMNQTRTIIQYDSNNCGSYTNQSFVEYRASESCTYISQLNYWVSPTGISSWNNCKSTTTLTGTGACNLTTDNKNARAGDIIYLRGGKYLNLAINPSYSGNKTHKIIFTNYDNENVILDSCNSSYDAWGGTWCGLGLGSRSYIKINGITINNSVRALTINDGDYNEISNCVFNNYTNTAQIYNNATFNLVHDSVFSKAGYVGSDCNDEGGILSIGVFTSTTDFTSNNLIENNNMYHGSHHIIEINTPYNVIRNNYIHNEEWIDCSLCGRPTGFCGNRNAGSPSPSYNGYRSLWENNSLGYGGIPSDGTIGAGLEFSTALNIIRYNRVYDNAGPGIMFYYKNSPSYPNNNYVYFNTLFNNSWDNYATIRAGIAFVNSSGQCKNNSIKNNIIYANREGDFSYHKNSALNQKIINNWNDTDGDPKFINPGLSTPFNENLPDLKLRSDSPCIDKGAWLTTITSNSGSGNSFVVNDSNYFMDGWGMQALGVLGDIIQLEGQTKRAKIINVDYSTNTITVDESLTWTKGQGVSLAYSGNKPDIGAYEYY